MINLILDTNILHQEGIKSGRMQVLKKLTDAEIVKLYLPEIVKREFYTKRVDSVSDLLEKTLTNFKGIHKKIESQGEIKTEITSIEAKVRNIQESLRSVIDEEISSWQNEFGVEVLSFVPDDISIVMDDYFTGKGAFKSLKNRDDIPDSMIHTSICRLADKVDKVYLIIKDGTFKNCMSKHPKVEVFDSLADFFKYNPIEEFLANEHLREYFEGRSFSKSLTQYLALQEDMIGQVYIPDGNVGNTDLIGIKVFNTEINFPISSNIKDLCISDFYAISTERFTAEISFITTASVHFISNYGSFLELERDSSRDVDMDSMNGEGICDLYESYQARFTGSIELALSESFNLEQISNLVEGLVEDDSKLHIDLDIDFAKLLDDIV
jgi:hypothetical protein